MVRCLFMLSRLMMLSGFIMMLRGVGDVRPPSYDAREFSEPWRWSRSDGLGTGRQAQQESEFYVDALLKALKGHLAIVQTIEAADTSP